MIHKRKFQVRIYECDSLGHVNNAVYLKYLQQSMLEAAGLGRAWVQHHEEIWVLRRMSLQYVKPAFFGDELDVSTWVSDISKASAIWQYTIYRGDELLLRGQAEWVWVNALNRKPMRVPQEFIKKAEKSKEVALIPADPPEENVDSKVFQWKHRVHRYELDVMQHVNFSSYLNWIEEAMFRSFEHNGWGVERMKEENFFMVQIRHESEYAVPARHGDLILGTSRAYWMGKVRGTWLHELHHAETGELMFRDFSTGAFLTLEGRPTKLPEQMMIDVNKGGKLD